MKGVSELEPVPVVSGADESCESCEVDIIHKEREKATSWVVGGCRRNASHLHVTYMSRTASRYLYGRNELSHLP